MGYEVSQSWTVSVIIPDEQSTKVMFIKQVIPQDIKLLNNRTVVAKACCGDKAAFIMTGSFITQDKRWFRENFFGTVRTYGNVMFSAATLALYIIDSPVLEIL